MGIEEGFLLKSKNQLELINEYFKSTRCRNVARVQATYFCVHDIMVLQLKPPSPGNITVT